MSRAFDMYCMSEALRLAAMGRGSTWPNPMVGAVLVRGRRIVGRGFHRAAGEPHAEIHALRQAGALARGAVCAVNLEPCCHHGRTPPCTNALIEAGVAAVLYGMQDPNPDVAGVGLLRLREAGITVRGPILETKCRALNAPFLIGHTLGRPAVSLKLALSLDGFLADATGDSRWITGPAARARGHRLRAEHQVICVGAGTLRADDPRLTPRDSGGIGRRTTIRAVIARTAPDLRGKRILEGLPENPIWLLLPEGAARSDAARAAIAAGAEVIGIAGDQTSCEDPWVDLAAALSALHGREVRTVLCEGGAYLATALLRAGLVDRLHLFRAPIMLGAMGGKPGIDDLGLRTLSGALPWRRIATLMHGPDIEEVLIPPEGKWCDPL